MTELPSVGILAYDGVNALSLVSVHDALMTAACDLPVTVYSLVPSDEVSSDSGLGLVPDDVLIGTPDIVVVPGGRDDGPDGTAPAYPSELPDRLEQLAEAGATVVGIGSGALALGEAGLLTDRTATTAPAFRDELTTDAGTVVDEDIVEGDGVLTAAGPNTALEVGRRLGVQHCEDVDVGGADRDRR
ncbi:DJ-1/PfpI family protein [Halanaeroarchaeum sulfurireducens]|uniref:DJ-1/PfpI domain-containing protein n=1 Tax=Halanaeroarchaeum sulfurireducens TaxID=1604004 RepID=A0A0F7P9B0_9EURY|nr:DJ-1/PfpI family protein [Halanaeroarchaeum sulfurireducens]AKH96785.1 hypothetical protein HLASF_0276 [Halanaeroarchaeum sulfurireducens]ALG81187.1 hypothetical protein HLASA_0276 [Halanaeroarchaeum sulfurireducens]